jgi:hypothetical protein
MVSKVRHVAATCRLGKSSTYIYTKMLFIGLQDATTRSDLTLSRRDRRLTALRAVPCDMSTRHITTTIETFVDIMSSTLIFSASEDEILICEVQNNTLLYNIGGPNYKNIIQKNDI